MNTTVGSRDFGSSFALFDQISDAVIITDLDARIQWGNAESLRRINMTLPEIIGCTPDVWLSTETGNVTALQAIEKCRQNGSFRFQPTFQDAAGVHQVSDVRLELLSDDTGTPTGIVSISRDITDQTRMENELLQAHKTKVIGELAGGVAHDINNTLAVILGNLELAQMEVSDTERTELLQQAAAAVQRGAGVTHRLLAYARKQPLQPDTLDPGDVLATTDRIAAPIFMNACRLNTVVDRALWPVMADRAQLETVLLNLLVNARDAIGAEGAVTLEARNLTIEADNAKPGQTLAPGDYVTFSVTDDGSGIAPDVIKKVVDPFFSTKPVGKGSGLGLSMAFGFAKQSGGHLDIRSESGVGTTVDVHLPRTQRPSMSASSDIAHDTPARAPRIFVLDDNIALLKITCRRLIHAGYEVLSASSVAEALSQSRHFSAIDVFLLDVILSDARSGVDFAQTLTELGVHAPVVFMSGCTDDVHLPTDLANDRPNSIRKPFSDETLIRTLHGVCRRDLPGTAADRRIA